MKLKITLLLTTFFILCNCTENKYRYVEKIKNSEQNTLSYKSTHFSSKNDSTAYMEAYMKFLASSNVSDFSKKKIKSDYKTPISFSIYNSNEVDITNYNFKTKKEWESTTRKKFDVSKEKSYVTIDITTQKELRKKFSTIKIDGHSIFYTPKLTENKSDSLFAVYMKQKGNHIDSLRVKFTYQNEKFTFAKKIIFTTDNSSFTIPLTNSISSLDKHIEGFDEDITLHKDLIDAIMKSENISITFSGHNQEIVQKININQINESKKLITQYLSLL